MPGGRNSATYKRQRRARMDAARAGNEPCVRCHRPINYDLSGNHPFGPTLDHLFAVLHTGTEDFEQWQAGPSHRVCNLRHGGHIGHRAPAAAQMSAPRTSEPAPVVWEPSAVF